MPEATTIAFCYIYDEDAKQVHKDEWHRTFYRICWIHFVIHGQRNGILFNIVGKHTDSNTGSVGENIYTSQVRWHTYDNTYATSQGEYIF